jgi:hypothetical protein
MHSKIFGKDLDIGSQWTHNESMKKHPVLPANQKKEAHFNVAATQSVDQ